MKPTKLFIPLLLALTSATLAHADWLIKQKMETPKGEGEVLIKSKGDIVLVTLPKTTKSGGVTVITNVKTGDNKTVIHARKTVMIRSAAVMKATMENEAKKKPQVTPGTLVDTGKKEKLGAYECSIFSIEDEDDKTLMWVVPSYPNGEKMKEIQDKFAAKTMSRKPKEPEGIILKTVSENAKGERTTTTLISIEATNIPDSEFEAPKDYTEVIAPEPPTGGKPE